MTDSDALFVKFQALNAAIKARARIKPNEFSDKVLRAENEICNRCRDLLTVYHEGEDFILGWDSEIEQAVAKAITELAEFVSASESSQRRLLAILKDFHKTRGKREISMSV